ncbi:citrate/2-methylcitrate synthase [Nonomuraea purpurea]|uniref:citrate synthase (unknown stereospecificity) n=1 Tax=Nonomuraea purpurea TaxID=1849276 RepID=A0ABV8GBF9_9ACTN
MPEECFLTTSDVAKRLGVKPETVYAYVSRGLLTNVRPGDRRGSLFAESEVEALAERRRSNRRPTGVVERTRTSLTLLTENEVYYRGLPLSELVATEPFEAVARLLWTGRLGDREPFRAPRELLDVATRAVATLPQGVRTTDRIRVAVVTAGAADHLRHDPDPTATTRRAAAIMAVAVDALAEHPHGDERGLGVRLWPSLAGGRDATADEATALTTLLTVMADHDLAASTLVARVAASTRAHPYAVVSAGLGAMDGEQHGSTSTLARRLLLDALDDPVAALAERLRGGAPIPGFGHRVYTAQDPRANIIFALLQDSPVLATVDWLTEQLADRPEHFPNASLALAAFAIHHGLVADAGESIFAIARMAGWVAHALEEYGEATLRFRAEGLYRGPSPGRSRLAAPQSGTSAGGADDPSKPSSPSLRATSDSKPYGTPPNGQSRLPARAVDSAEQGAKRGRAGG